MALVVPVRDELAVLPALWARLERLRCGTLVQHRVCVVFVDDGSTDGSGPWLLQLAYSKPDVMFVALSCATGHQEALCAGLDCAPGDAVVTLDADLQDPPEYIEQMLALWQRGADVVHGVRLGRPGEGAVKRWCAASYYRLLCMLSAARLPKDCGDFRLIDRRIVGLVQALPRRSPYVRGMVASIACTQVTMPYMRAPRLAGQTSYAWSTMLELAWAGVVQCAAPWRVGLCLMVLGGTAFELALWAGATPRWQIGAAMLAAVLSLIWALRCGRRVQRRRPHTLGYRIAQVVPPRARRQLPAARS